MAPKLLLLTSSGSQKKRRSPDTYVWVRPRPHIHKEYEPRFPLTPHFLHSGLSSNPNKYRCLLRVLYPVRRPVTTLDWVLLKDKNLILVPGQSPEINSRPCLWVLPRSRQLAHCWLINQQPSLFFISRLETPKAGSGPGNLRAEPTLASPSAISLPRTPASPGTQ
jgi:hypothetical protein